MNIINILSKKMNNFELSKEEIDFFIEKLINREITDYQISALLSAIYINGMSDDEIYNLTIAMRDSGEVIKFNEKDHNGMKIIDKHSTGGIGDKVTLIIAPIIGALGIKIAKISGKGLGHTGGTIDKLNSIGVNTSISINEAKEILQKTNIFIIEQTCDIAPADKEIYSLRNDTATVSSLPLIVSSIMSKKLAIDVDYIYLDVKIGGGGFFSNIDDARSFSRKCIEIGKKENKKVVCHITNMSKPLGRTIGNQVEIYEVLAFLNGDFLSKSLKELIYDFVSDILIDCKIATNLQDAINKINEVINSKKALNLFIDWSKTQGQKLINLKNIATFFRPKYTRTIKAETTGYLGIKNSKLLGDALVELKGGRKVKTDKLDYTAGMYFCKEVNDYVESGEDILTIFANEPISDEIYVNLCNNFVILIEKNDNIKEILEVIR